MFLVTPVVPCFCYERDDSLASVGAPKLFLYGNPMSRFRISLVSCLTLLFTVSPQIQLRLVRVLEWTNFFLLCVDRACFHRLGSSAPSALRAQMINCRSTSVTSPRSPHSKILLRSEDSKSGDNLEDMSAHLDVLNLSVLKLITSTSASHDRRNKNFTTYPYSTFLQKVSIQKRLPMHGRSHAFRKRGNTLGGYSINAAP